MKVVKKASCLFLTAILAACGGGSGSGGSFGGLGTTSTTASKEAETTSASGGKEAVTIQKLDGTWVKIADEGQSVSLATATVVQYGANDSFAQKTVTGTLQCTNAYFGGDPLPFVAKGCYSQTGTGSTGSTASTGSSGTTTTRIASEDQSLTSPSGTVVQYGAGSSWCRRRSAAPPPAPTPSSARIRRPTW